MDKKTKTFLILFVIFLVAFIPRLYFSLQTPVFSTDDSYFHVRQAQHIAEFGTPIVNDELSFNGRTRLFLPAFHYIFSLVYIAGLSDTFIKVLIALFSSSIIFVVYGLAKMITKDSVPSLYGAFISGFIPLYFVQTFNHVTPLLLFIPLFFLLIYLFTILKSRTHTSWYLLLLVVLTLMHPLIVLFILGLCCYLLIVYFERLKQQSLELEVCIFSIFFVIWAVFLTFKDAFITHGMGVLWGNTPLALLSLAFQDFTLTKALYSIGFIPFLFSVFIVYRSLFVQKKRSVYILLGMTIALIALLWFRSIDIISGLMILGVISSILFAQGYKNFSQYITTTKVGSFTKTVHILFFLLVVLTSVVSSAVSASVHLSEETLSVEEFHVLNELREKTPKNTVILASLDEGNYIQSIAERATVIDNDFLLIEKSDQEYESWKRLFITPLEIDALVSMEEKNIGYVYVSPRVKTLLPITEVKYTQNTQCFVPFFIGDTVEVFIRNPACKVRVVDTTN